MFTPETLANFVQTTGFEILYFDTDEKRGSSNSGLPDTHIRLIARRTEQLPTSVSTHSLSKFDLFKLSPFVIYCYYFWFYRLRFSEF